MDRVRADVEALEDELNQLKSWKVNMENKFNYFEKVRKELEQGAEKVKKVLEGKDKKIKDLEGQLRQAKEETVREYRDSNALLSKLGISFLEGFDDAFCQVREAHLDLNFPRLKLKTQSKPPLCPLLRRTLRSFLLETQPLVTRSQPKPRMFNKFNPSWMKPISPLIL